MKIFEGNIVSVGMNKTVVVEIVRRTPHPLYKKLIKLSSKFKVDDTGFEDLGIGTKVKIVETRPISKYKHFKILSVSGVKKNDAKAVKTEKVEIVEAKVEVETKVAVKKSSAKQSAKKPAANKVVKAKKETK